MRTKFVIRVVLNHDEALKFGGLIEQFRYMGFIRVHRDDRDGSCLDIYPPADIRDTQEWCDRHAERMRAFEFNAVRAPAMP